MATGTHPMAQEVDGASVSAEKRASGAMLRPAMEPETSEHFSGPSSQLSGRGSAGAAAADFYFPERSYADDFAAGREPVALQDGLGAMRGFVFVLGMYLVMGVIGLAGLMVWHWLR